MHDVLGKDGEDTRMTGLFNIDLIREGIAGRMCEFVSCATVFENPG